VGRITGLLADSLDMLADASVYGIALYAVGRSGSFRQALATASGVLQIALGFAPSLRLFVVFFTAAEPGEHMMIAVGLLLLRKRVSC